jgi:hypothetical protein
MTVADGRTARVRVDYSQYQVAAGAEMTVGDDSVPGILRDMGGQAVAVLTGLQSGVITVTARAVATSPAQVDSGWEVVAETDLDSPEGIISVLDWGGPDHPELGDLAIAGPGRYRLRVHARNRESKDEEHHLLIWPAAEPAPPGLLTSMDSYGRLLTGEEPDDKPPLDSLELAAGAAVRQLAALVSGRDAVVLSGELTVVRSAATVPGTPRKVWNQVSIPWSWLANHGTDDPADFLFVLLDEPGLGVRGNTIVDEPPTRIEFLWSWTTSRWAEIERPMPTGVRARDPVTGEVASVTRTGRDWELEPSMTLPRQPTTVRISLRRDGKGATAVVLEHLNVPVELAALVQPFWDWALGRALPDRVTRSPFYGYPWHRV